MVVFDVKYKRRHKNKPERIALENGTTKICEFREDQWFYASTRVAMGYEPNLCMALTLRKQGRSLPDDLTDRLRELYYALN